uniref:finTRIM family, member 86 n=1 Tax=Scatophagus argus TaxID=75038 RepID=UPI001ED82273|nr:finTRIM family, member 86 [Scatophagus argus]
MASAWSEEETFVCSVCLDMLKDPATLPCGHSYCLACIQNHWDKRDSKGQYSCPQCRQVFSPRPSLAKSTVLAEIMEKLRTNSLKQSSSAPPSMPLYLEVLPDTGPQQGSMYPQLPTVEPRPCPQHNRPLDLFCHEDKECVCEVCYQHGHKGHRVLKPQEERMERQKELVQMQVEVQRRIQETEKKLQEIPHVARQNKALVQALQQESTDLFSELVNNMNATGTQVGELLSTHEASLGSQVEGKIHMLEQEVAQLRWKSAELCRLADMQDHICFLKNFLTMEPLCQKGTTEESILSQEEVVVASVRSAMKELQELIQNLCKANLAKIFKIVNHEPVIAATANGAAEAGSTAVPNSGQATTQNTVYEMTTDPPPLPPPRPQRHEDSSKFPIQHPICPQASAPPPPQPQAFSVTTTELVNPQPKTRGELLKFRFEPTMDPNTVYRHVRLSDGDRKATMRAENLNPPDHPERFDFWRQVLCREPLAGSPYYWEVEWTGQKINLGVAYKEMERKGSANKSRLGHNALSWSLNWSGTGFSFWHDGQEKLLGSPKAQRLGIYLDQHAGILAFYRISNNQADLIYRHQSQFTGPLYPGFRFWAGVGATVTVCQLD